jgi:hypothetical protein
VDRVHHSLRGLDPLDFLEATGEPDAGRASLHRSTNRRLLFGQVRALAWSFIRVLLGGGWVAPPAFKEARMNNVLRNYS